MSCKILTYEQIDRTQWASLVESHPKGNVFQTPEMYNVYTQTPGYEPHVIVLEQDKHIEGVLLWVVMREKGVNAELIELKGYNRDQVTALMYSCDAFLMTSKTEGSPQVIKEAMACGCPIVSVDVGDVKERVEGLGGCYVAQSREPEELAFLLENAINYGRTKGHQHIIDMQLDNKQVAKRIVKIYEKVVN